MVVYSGKYGLEFLKYTYTYKRTSRLVSNAHIIIAYEISPRFVDGFPLWSIFHALEKDCALFQHRRIIPPQES